jgi:arylsulfatase A-like enzyme
LQPFQHGLVKNGHSLRPGVETLAELFADLGYETAGFASVGFLSELSQGFDVFEAEWRTGDLTVDRALAWLDQRQPSGPPFFLWVHLYDAHKLKGPREKLQADIAALQPADAAARRRFVDSLTAEHGLDPEAYPSLDTLVERYDTYDAGIRFADRQVARLFDRVDALRPETLWIVTADHGEGLGNHDYDEHGRFLYNEQLHVPLIVVGPGIAPGTPRRLVRLVDILPTLAQWAGFAERAAAIPAEGYSLLDPRPALGALAPRFAFAERRPKDRARNRQSWEEGEVRSLQTARYKLIDHSQGDDELYDLERDPFELENLSALADQAERVHAMTRHLREVWPGWDTVP